MRLESEPGLGSTFHVYLPLPSLSDRPAALPATAQALLLLSAQQQPAAEILEFSHRQGLEIHPVRAGDDLEALLAEIQPVALAWDLTGASAGPDDWALVQRVRKHPRLSQLPFILYGHEPATPPAAPVGVTSVVVKPVGGEALAEAIGRLRPVGAAGPILIVDDDPATRERYRILIERKLPGYPVRVAENGTAALVVMTQETPGLVVLDLMMPGMDGFEVLDWMRAEPRTRGVPVLVLSNRLLTLEDVRRLERHAQVTLQSKDILGDDEIAAALHQSLFGKALPAQTGALVKRALAYFHQHYAQPLSRAEIARAIGVSGSYLTKIFRKELGISPWEYLNRYRIKQAKELLRQTDKSVTAIAFEVGFNDPAYFNRVFHKIVGKSPGRYRAEYAPSGRSFNDGM
jgi:AraC-like DNA-binding protein